MSHMVIFQAPGGSPGYNQFETLDSAVAFVEELRNERDVSNARIFALEEVKFELRPYFRVELQALTRSTGQGTTANSFDTPASDASRPAPEQTSAPVAGARSPGSPAPAPSTAAAAPSPSPSPQAPSAPAAPAAPAAPSAPASSPQTSAPGAPAQEGSAGTGRDPQTGQPARRGLFGR